MIYFISGLGADERVFQFLTIPDQPFKYIQWVPTQKGESLKTYAHRLIDQIDTSQTVYLVGVSFGGMIAQEIAKRINCQKVVIISSVKSPSEFNWQLNFVRKTKIHRLVPSAFLRWSNALTADYYFSIKTKKDAQLLKMIVADTDQTFLTWAIEAIMTWENSNPLEDIFHIHGTKDRIFPVSPIKNAHLIDGGGHFMIVDRAEEISRLIIQAIGL